MSLKAREKWRKNLATLRLLCMVCIQCRKAVAKLVPKDSWQRLTSTRASKVTCYKMNHLK